MQSVRYIYNLGSKIHDQAGLRMLQYVSEHEYYRRRYLGGNAHFLKKHIADSECCSHAAHPTCNPPTPNVQPSNTQRATLQHPVCNPPTPNVQSACANHPAPSHIQSWSTPLVPILPPTPPPPAPSVHCSCRHSPPYPTPSATSMVHSARANTPLPSHPRHIHGTILSCPHSPPTPPHLLCHIHGTILSCPQSPPTTTSSATSMGQSSPLTRNSNSNNNRTAAQLTQTQNRGGKQFCTLFFSGYLDLENKPMDLKYLCGTRVART